MHGRSLTPSPRGKSSRAGAAVAGFLRQRLAAYKIPKAIEFREQLPREDTGKLLKRKLRAPY